jgi:hypothetical protein
VQVGSVTTRVLLAARFLILFIVGFSLGMSEFVLVWVSDYLRIAPRFGSYPLWALLAVVLVTFYLGALLRRRIGYGLLAGALTGAISFFILLALLVPFALLGGE